MNPQPEHLLTNHNAGERLPSLTAYLCKTWTPQHLHTIQTFALQMRSSHHWIYSASIGGGRMLCDGRAAAPSLLWMQIW